MALAFLLNIWWLLVLIGVMILIHELGHFWAARAFDVKVEVFSFGLDRGCSGSGVAKRITGSRRFCSAGM